VTSEHGRPASGARSDELRQRAACGTRWARWSGRSAGGVRAKVGLTAASAERPAETRNGYQRVASRDGPGPAVGAAPATRGRRGRPPEVEPVRAYRRLRSAGPGRRVFRRPPVGGARSLTFGAPEVGSSPRGQDQHLKLFFPHPARESREDPAPPVRRNDGRGQLVTGDTRPSRRRPPDLSTKHRARGPPRRHRQWDITSCCTASRPAKRGGGVRWRSGPRPGDPVGKCSRHVETPAGDRGVLLLVGDPLSALQAVATI